MSQQGRRQSAVRDRSSSVGTLEGDWHALFDEAVVVPGPIDGRMIAYLQQETGLAITDIDGLKHAYATRRGAHDWASLGRFNGLYVDADAGDDGNPGTSADKPLRSLAAAAPLLGAGDTLWLKRGSAWREQLTLNGKAGSGSDPVRVRPYGDDSDLPPTLLGSYSATGTWTLVSGTEYAQAVSTAPVNAFHVVSDTLDHESGAVVRLRAGTVGSLTIGEWAYSGGSLHINIGQDPTGERIEVPRGVDGVDTIYGLLIDSVSSHVDVQGIRCLFAKNNGVEVQGASANITLQNVECNWNGSDGIGVHGNGTDLSITRCDIVNNGRDRALTDAYGDGVSFHDLSTGRVAHCTIVDNQKSGLGHTGAPTVESHGNRIKGNNANIRVFGSLGGRFTFTHNLVLRTDDDDTGIAAIWLGDNTGTETEINGYNNTVINQGAATGIVDGLRALDQVNGLWLNNIFQGFVEGIDHRAGKLRGDFNCFHENGVNYGTAMTPGRHDLHLDPMFEDESAGDYRPRSSSPLVGAGIGQGLTRDYFGNGVGPSPTIGAIEVKA